MKAASKSNSKNEKVIRELYRTAEVKDTKSMNGTSRGRNELSEKVAANKMSETLKIADGITVNIVWQQAQC